MIFVEHEGQQSRLLGYVSHDGKVHGIYAVGNGFAHAPLSELQIIMDTRSTKEVKLLRKHNKGMRKHLGELEQIVPR